MTSWWRESACGHAQGEDDLPQEVVNMRTLTTHMRFVMIAISAPAGISVSGRCGVKEEGMHKLTCVSKEAGSWRQLVDCVTIRGALLEGGGAVWAGT